MRRTAGISSYHNSVVQPVTGKDKPRNNLNKQSFFQILKAQIKEDRPTQILGSLAIIFGLAIIISQICIAKGYITGPIYL